MTEQAMLTVIDKLADRLTIPTTEIINAYMASGYKSLIFFVISFIIFVSNLLLTISAYEKEKKECRCNDVSFVCALMTLCLFLITIAIGADVVFWLINPKAYAITELIKHLK